MLGSQLFVARFASDMNALRVFDAEGVFQDGADAVCLGDMLGELLDEMGRRGFDVASTNFAINCSCNVIPL
jgi:hypothetical protein